MMHPRFPCYEIQEDGRVFRVRHGALFGKGNCGPLGEVHGRVLKDSGYRQFKLVDADKKKILIRANRLVCETFHGPAPSPKHHAAHNDGDRLNNHKDNLRWATPKENAADCFEHGTRQRSANLRLRRRMSKEQRDLLVKTYLSEGYAAALPLAEKFGIASKHISAIARAAGFNNNHRRGRGLPGFSALERRA